MSRIGKLPITVPAGVTVTVDEDNTVTVKGPKGTLTQAVNRDITLKQEGNVLTLERPSDAKPHKAMHGLYRSLVHNMVVGVTEGRRRQEADHQHRLQPSRHPRRAGEYHL